MKKNRLLTENVKLIDNQLFAEMLSISPSQLYALRQCGRVPLKTLRLGGSVRFYRRDAEDWIAAGCPTSWKGGRK